MRFTECLAAGKFAVALEITPPQGPLKRVLLRRASLLGEAAHGVNVIQRPGRQSSLDACLELLAAGVHPTWHLVTRGSQRDELAAEMQRAHAGGVRQVLVIRGDHEGTDSPDTPSIREVVALARDLMPGATIGATLNQYAPNAEAVLKNLLPKLRAGASYVQTQPAFDIAQLRPLAEAAKSAAPGTRVIAMAMPLLSVEQATKIGERVGVKLSGAFLTRLAEGGEDAAWAAFRETIAALVSCGFVDGVAIMTFGTDAPPEVGERICAALRAAGA
jgi:methylenetetrahydrofolate reductase (NADPH)